MSPLSNAAAVTTAKVNEVKSVVVEAERTTVSSEKNVDAEETTQNGDWAVVGRLTTVEHPPDSCQMAVSLMSNWADGHWIDVRWLLHDHHSI